MKKTLLAILAAATLLSGALAFGACGSKDNSDSGTASEKNSENTSLSSSSVETVPAGYTAYADDYIRFAYPESWVKTGDPATMVTIAESAQASNNIVVTYLPKTNLYESMTSATFATTLQPTLEAMGMTVSDVVVEQKAKDGKKITSISYSATMMTIAMSQNMFLINSGDKTCQITVTQISVTAGLTDNVYNTLKALK